MENSVVVFGKNECLATAYKTGVEYEVRQTKTHWKLISNGRIKVCSNGGSIAVSSAVPLLQAVIIPRAHTIAPSKNTFFILIEILILQNHPAPSQICSRCRQMN